jgi:peptidoglycan/LPS O-acetylase OafA/YrhL
MTRVQAGAAHGLRADIQGLRGLAVLLVVLYHAGLPGFGGGFIGVDVFFIISGFVISALLLREQERSGRISLLTFYARRARRLLPASLLVIAVVVLLQPWLLSPLERRDVLSAARASAVYLANFWFAGRAVDYLGGGGHGNPFLHMWSLAIEEQFYLFWPLLLVGLGMLSRTGDRRRRMTVGIAIVSLSSLLGCLWMTARDQPWAFFGMPMRAWEFGLGALACLATGWPIGMVRSWVAPALGAFGAMLMLASAVWIDDALPFPGPWALPPAIGTALVLWAVHAGRGPLSRILAAWPLARLGDLSYSWYLWHWPALVVARQLWPDAGLVARLVAVLASLALAALSLHGLENPVRFGRWPSRREGFTLAAALAATAVAAIALSWNVDAMDRALDQPPYKQFAAAVHDRAAPADPRCQADFDAIVLGSCSFGSASGARAIVVLLGDSHASHWFPALQALAQQQGWRLVSLTKTACPMVDVEVRLANRNREYLECSAWRANMLQRVEPLRPSLVIIANHGGGYAVPGGEWQAGMVRTLKRLSARGAAVAVLHDTPWSDERVPECLARAQWLQGDPAAACGLVRAAAMARNAVSRAAEERAVAAVPGSFAVDLTASFCDRAVCATWADSVVRFTDGHHLSRTFSLALAPALETALRTGAAPLFSGR